MSLKSIKGIGPATEEKLAEAGVSTVDDLAAADAASLAETTGLSEGRVAEWIALAQDVGGDAADATSADDIDAGEHGETDKNVVDRSLEAIDNARIVLAEGMERARVKVEDDVIAELPILTARAKENAEAKLEAFKGNVIVLKERTDTALLRMEEEIYEGLPLFKEKIEQGQDEVRVRVREIRERRVQPAVKSFGQRIKGLFNRDSGSA